MSPNPTFQKIKNHLQSNSINFRHIHHKPTKTSEQAAKVRGQNLSIGGKALVLKIDDSFKLLVLSAAKRLNSAVVEKYFTAKKLRFATKEELLELTGLEPGSVPPFGQPILNLKLFVDQSIVDNQKIAFNAASLTDSIVISVKDYLKLTKPTIFDFSK